MPKAPKRLIIDIDESIHAKIKEICSKKRESMKEFITGILVKEIIRSEYRKSFDKNI